MFEIISDIIVAFVSVSIVPLLKLLTLLLCAAWIGIIAGLIMRKLERRIKK